MINYFVQRLSSAICGLRAAIEPIPAHTYVALNAEHKWAIYCFGKWWTETEIQKEMGEYRGSLPPHEWIQTFNVLLGALHRGIHQSKELL